MLLILITWLGLFNWHHHEEPVTHAIYISVLEVEQLSAKENGIIRVKIFMDDLQDAIYNQTARHINLVDDSCAKNKELVEAYFKKHLKIKINSTELEYKLVSCEVNDISIWFEYSFVVVGNWQTLEIEADYLIELFPTQSNVVSLNYLKQKKMFRLSKGETLKRVSFE